jgi:beta-glucanase (GH16 family)
MWPYSYDSCDLGTFPNQTTEAGQPAAATTGAPDGGPLSYLPGQRLSACTCPGSDHPGPNTNTGRGVPEVDVLEAQVDVAAQQGQVSQSLQIAPYDYMYNFNNVPPATTIYNETATTLNTYVGGVFQQALSAVTYIDSGNYNDQGYAPYGFELWSNPNNREEGYVTWYSNGVETWTVTSASIGPDTVSEVQQRLISEEPMVSRCEIATVSHSPCPCSTSS